MTQSAEVMAAFRAAVELEAAIDDHESIWRGRIVWRHRLAKATVAVSPYYSVTRAGSPDPDVMSETIRQAVRAKWERAGEPLDIARGFSANDPHVAAEIEVELLFDADHR